VFFSSKISNTVLNFCDREGIERSVLYNQSDWPEEFLKDPSCWLESHKLEELLRHVEREIGDIEKIALQSPKLHAWGPLDSVLKLMGRPQDILSQPDRFMSYFISPPPPINYIDRNAESVSFRIPISSEEYPLVTRYLKGAFESLPVYVGKSPAQVVWNENIVSISWTAQQESLLSAEEPSNVNPVLVTNLMHAIEKAQKELEEKNREIQSQATEIISLKSQLSEAQSSITGQPMELANSMNKLNRSVMRLQDYLVRAQQLITVLVGTERTNPIIQGALKRVDWDHVTKEFPRLARETSDEIQKLKDALKEESSCQRSSSYTQGKFWIAEANPQ